MFRRLFIEHPASVGETYGEHLRTAMGFALTLLGAGLACLLHALLPFLFVDTGSRAVERLHARMIANRSRLSSGPGRAGARQNTDI